ncbi:hypothetical protein RJT34_24172 [Clitoria ternatea]|uniref:LCR n=1 Tax=Clitoria ternatea TaxID=43366 RepID=A0AAN9IH84_CLITE
MSRMLVSTLWQKLIFATMVIVLLSVGVRSKTFCPGTCEKFPNCNAVCEALGYQKGQCVPPDRVFCCCGHKAM